MNPNQDGRHFILVASGIFLRPGNPAIPRSQSAHRGAPLLTRQIHDHLVRQKKTKVHTRELTSARPVNCLISGFKTTNFSKEVRTEYALDQNAGESAGSNSRRRT